MGKTTGNEMSSWLYSGSLFSVRTQYYVTVRYGYHTRILRPRIIQSYAPILRPQFYGPPKYDPEPDQ